MGFRWKPSASERNRYREAMQEAEKYSFIGSCGPIRTGDVIEWVDKMTCTHLAGVVLRHSYGDEQGQHTFTIGLDEPSCTLLGVRGGKKLVKGRNLYDRLLAHEKPQT